MADETNTVSDLADLKTLATGGDTAPATESQDAPAGFTPVTSNAPLREQEVYFARPTLRLVINQVFGLTDRAGQYDVIATVKGGGLSGQAGAVKHGIAQALSKYEPTLRATVKAAGFLTRDSRVVERKKYGRAKARRSFQFSKR